LINAVAPSALAKALAKASGDNRSPVEYSFRPAWAAEVSRKVEKLSMLKSA
jgi:hypothetical protein